MGEITQPCAAIVFAGRDAEEAEGSHLFPQLRGKLVTTVDFSGKRSHTFAGKAAHTLPQHFGIAICCVDQARFIHLLLSVNVGAASSLPRLRPNSNRE